MNKYTLLSNVNIENFWSFLLKWWRQFAVVIVLIIVVLISVYLPYRFKVYLLITSLGIFSGLFLFFQPQLGIVLLVIASVAVPFGIGTGTQTEINTAVLGTAALSGLWILDLILIKKNASFFWGRAIYPVLVIIFSAIISFGFGQVNWFSGVYPAPIRAQLGGLALFVLSCFAFLLTANQIKDSKWLQGMVFAFLAAGSLYIVLRIVELPIPILGNLFKPGSTGSVFWIWMVVLATSQAIYNKNLQFYWRLLLGGLILATLFVAIVKGRDWTSGWLPALVGAAATIWLGLPKNLKVISVVVGTFSAMIIPSLIPLLMTGDNPYSLVTRLEAWKILWEIIKVNPLFGVGPANYYWYTPLFSIMGYFSLSFNSHNNYIDILAQTGFLGLFAFLWFAFDTGRLAWLVKDKVSEGFERAYIIGGFGGLLGILTAGMFGDWVIPFVYNVGYAGFRSSILGWIFLGGIVALAKKVYPAQEIKPDRK
jgi:O-antigen ligase